MIGVESSIDKGSVFWVELNRTHNKQRAGKIGQDKPAAIAAMRTKTPVHTLLCIEDNPDNLALIEHIIARRDDIHLLSSIDANQGIAIAKGFQPDLILMDINLPGLSALQALKILADDPATSHIPELAISANAMPRDIQSGMDAGFFRYITKPIKVDALLATLDEALESVKPKLV